MHALAKLAVLYATIFAYAAMAQQQTGAGTGADAQGPLWNCYKTRANSPLVQKLEDCF